MFTQWRSARGSSATEVVLVVGVLGVLGGMAVVQFGIARASARGDGAMRVVMAQLNIARERSITERRNVRVAFGDAPDIQLVREEVPEGETVLATIPLEGGVKYELVATLPDTPETFGNESAIDFGDAESTTFTTDGTLVNETGQPVNGTVFLSVPGERLSARAVTILGATGQVRAYRWDGARWVRV